MPANGTSALDAINFGVSTGGAAGAAETTSTLGLARVDVRTPPDQTRIWGAQINNMIALGMAISAFLKGGTRVQCLPQSSNPFGASEAGFYVDNSGNPSVSYNGAASKLALSAGVTVTQNTNINTSVTANGASGVITTQTATTAARTAEVGFAVANSSVLSTSVVVARVVGYSGTVFTNGQPDVEVTQVINGQISMRVINRDATNALNGTMKIHFIVN